MTAGGSTHDLAPSAGGCRERRCHDVLSRLWAKDPEDTLVTDRPFSPTPHLLDTAAAIEGLWSSWLRPGLRVLVTEAIAPSDEVGTVRALMLMAALHDIGKINPLFQAQPYSPDAGAWRQGHMDRLAALGLPIADDGVVAAANLYVDRRRPGQGLSVARRHEYVGAYALLGKHPTRRLRVGGSWLPVAVAGHHGLWREAEDPYDGGIRDDHEIVDAILAGGWQRSIEAQRDLIEETIGLRVADLPPLADQAGPAFILVSGLLMMADWLASDDQFVSEGKDLVSTGLDPVREPERWLEERRSTMPGHLTRTLGRFRPLDDASIVMGDRALRPLQQAAVDLGNADGLWLVAFPTGEGKTKAAQLRHIQRPDEHLLFGLPTTATTDAMAATLRRDFHQTGNAVTKSHQYATFTQTSGISDEDLHLYADSWYGASLRRLFAPIAVATCDQILTAALTQKNTHMRLLAIANHHVVLDEVHTFDAYQRELLVEVLAWLGATGTRATLLSASIPEVDAVAYRDAYAHGVFRDSGRSLPAPFEPQYPGHFLLDPASGTDTSGGSAGLSAAVEPVRFDVVKTREIARDRALWALRQTIEHPRCHVAVVCNTVDSAIETARLVQAFLPESHDLIVLHSRMTRSQRDEVEQRLRATLGPPPGRADFGDELTFCEALRAYEAIRPVVVVATQVIEASLDLDFDLMASDLAPAPSLVQRVGRLWRFRDDTHRSRRHGAEGPVRQLTVFVAIKETDEISIRGCLPYEVAELRKVLGMIEGEPALRIPEDVQSFVDGGRVSAADYLPGDVQGGDLLDVVVAEEVSQCLGREMLRIEAAAVSKADLLKTIISPADISYGSLMALTAGPDDENAMRTRYVDLPSFTFLLFDSRQPRSRFVQGGAVPRWVQTATAEALASWQGAALPASGRHAAHLLELHDLTLASLGIDEWKPRSAVLKRQYPVDLALLGPAEAGRLGRFDDILGWS